MSQTKQNNRNSQSMFETLESRTMMSAAPLPHVAAAPVVHIVATVKPVAVKAAVVAKPVVKTPALPAIAADPTVTDPSITYKNFAADPLFSTAGPKPTDINQGDIGDCYFLSTLASVAKLNPTVIRNDFINNGDGTYTVKFFTTKQQVRVDAELPVWSDGSLAYASTGAQNCVWVGIFEKAYAVIRTHADTYASIDGGWMTDAFTALGLRSASVFAAATAKTMFTMLEVNVTRHEYLTFATGNNITDNAPLIADHAYMIDSVTVDKKGNPISLTLRNPWGTGGPAVDGSANNGYVTITAIQAFDNFSGIVIGLA